MFCFHCAFLCGIPLGFGGIVVLQPPVHFARTYFLSDPQEYSFEMLYMDVFKYLNVSTVAFAKSKQLCMAMIKPLSSFPWQIVFASSYWTCCSLMAFSSSTIFINCSEKTSWGMLQLCIQKTRLQRPTQMEQNMFCLYS